jgi:hypothetical protein
MLKEYQKRKPQETRGFDNREASLNKLMPNAFLENQQPAEKEKLRTGRFIRNGKLEGKPNVCRGKLPPFARRYL